MTTRLASYQNGKIAWAITYDGSNGVGEPDIEGNTPRVVADALSQVQSEQEAAGGRDADVDHIYERTAEAGATEEGVIAVHFAAIGAVRDPEVAWFDLDRKEYKAMRRNEQMEVLSLTGDVGVGQNGKPVVHTHVTLGRHDGTAFGGHLISAITSPTLEVFITTYPAPLAKTPDPETHLQLFALSRP